MTVKDKYFLIGEKSQSYETLKMNLINSVNGRKMPQTILFTCCLKGEGVSTIAANFAISASSDLYQKILYMDVNFQSPAAHEIFKVPTDQNVIELLKSGDYSNITLPESDKYQLSVLPARNGSFNNGEHKRLPELGQLLDQCKKKYDLTVIDAPPLVSSANITMSLSEYVDGVILVIETEKTRREVVKRMKEQLLNSGVNILGVVLNKRKFYVPKWLYKTL